MTKEQRLIKELTAKVTELEQSCKDKDNSLRFAQDDRSKLTSELNDLHSTFDLLGVPKRRKGMYSDLSANARLTLFMAQLNEIPVAQPTEEM